MLAGQTPVDGTEFRDPEPFRMRGAAWITRRLVRAVHKVRPLHPEVLSRFLAVHSAFAG